MAKITKNSLALPKTVKSIHGFIYAMFWLYVPIYLTIQGFSGYHIGLFIGLANLMAIISTLPSGIANDRIKSKKIILTALLLSIIYFTGLLTVTNIIILAGAFICGGLGRNLFDISVDSLAFKVIDRKKSSIQIGGYLAVLYFAQIIGFMIGGNVINSFGFPATLSSIIVLLFLTTIISVYLPLTHTFKFKLMEYKKDIFNKEVLFFMLIVFLFSLHFGAEATSYSLFLKTNLNLNLSQIGFYVGGAVIFLALSALFFSWKVQKGFDPKKVFYIGLIISGLGHILFSIQDNVLISFLLRCFHEIGDGAMIYSIFYGIVRIFNIERVGGNSSTITLTKILGTSFAAFIFGHFGAEYGYYLPLFITGFTNLAAFLLLFYFNKKVLPKAQ